MKENGKPTKLALLVIDVQKGLFEKSIPIYQAETFLENLKTLIDRARQTQVEREAGEERHAGEISQERGLVSGWERVEP